MTKRKIEYWVIPPEQDAEFVASGAVMRPGPLQELFPELTREDWRKAGFAFGAVEKEAVYLLPTARTKLRIPVLFDHIDEVVIGDEAGHA